MANNKHIINNSNKTIKQKQKKNKEKISITLIANKATTREPCDTLR